MYAQTALPGVGPPKKVQHLTRHVHCVQSDAGVTWSVPHLPAMPVQLVSQTLGQEPRQRQHASLAGQELGVRKVPRPVATAQLALGPVVMDRLHVICAQLASGHRRKLHQGKAPVCLVMLGDGARNQEPAVSTLAWAVLVEAGPAQLVLAAALFASRDVPAPGQQLLLYKSAKCATQGTTAALELQDAVVALLELGATRAAAATAANARQAAGAVWKVPVRASCVKHAGLVGFRRQVELLRSPLVQPARKDIGGRRVVPLSAMPAQSGVR